MSYYDGTKLLSLKDINGQEPVFFLCTTNRTGGKTTYINKVAINKFKSKKIRKFLLLYRYDYELKDCSEKFFKDIKPLFFPNDDMTDKAKAKGIYHELYLNDVPCGYAVAINKAEQVKKLSHFFTDVDFIILDEFQSETNSYCPNEIQKFISILTSVSRGNGKQYRYVPVVMLGNTVSLINPYYVELGITNRLKHNTNFLKGDGWVLEQGFVQSASDSFNESGIARAFNRNKYITYASQNVYLNDNKAFIENIKGNSKYVCTLKYENNHYAIREFSELGILYVDDKADITYHRKITVTTNDHDINYLMLQRNDLFINNLRNLFEKGCFRFKNLKCKEVLLKTISY